ncbi:MAG TPA: ATP synthase F1 subunit delta [Bacilli bacterium]|nr:ATP synthase F1 subunit delta [Bacilli bacterium]
MINAVAMQYAKALESLQLDYDKVVDDLQLLQDALKDKTLISFFDHPLIEKEAKKEVVLQTFPTFDQQLLYFIDVLIDNERMLILEDVIAAYVYLDDEKNNIMRVEIISSSALSKEQKEQLLAILEQRFDKKIKVSVIIDTKIIGGLIVKYNGQVLDDSVIGKLKSLKEIFGV